MDDQFEYIFDILLQQFDGNELGNPVNTTWLLSMLKFLTLSKLEQGANGSLATDKTADQAEKGGFLWNVSTANLTHYDISNFALGAQESGLDIAATEAFNITDKAIVSTTTSRASSFVSAPIASSPSTFTSSTATSSNPSSAVQPAGLQSTSTSTRTPKSSSKSVSVYIGIGAGLGLFLGLSLCLGFLIKCSRKRRDKQQTAISSQTDSGSTSNMNTSPFKSELATPFNVIRSFLSKSELPGKDNERPKGHKAIFVYEGRYPETRGMSRLR